MCYILCFAFNVIFDTQADLMLDFPMFPLQTSRSCSGPNASATMGEESTPATQVTDLATALLQRQQREKKERFPLRKDQDVPKQQHHQLLSTIKMSPSASLTSEPAASPLSLVNISMNSKTVSDSLISE